MWVGVSGVIPEERGGPRGVSSACVRERGTREKCSNTRWERTAKKKAEARRKAQEEAEKQRKKELEELEKRKAAEEQKRREREEREAAERAARKEEDESQERGRKSGGEGQADGQASQQSLIKLIMRDGALTQQQKQGRVQAIWAGKVDVGKMMAEYGSKQPAADDAGRQGAAQPSMPPKQGHGGVHQQHQQHQQYQQHQQHRQQANSMSGSRVLPGSAAPGQPPPAAAAPMVPSYASMPPAHSQLDLDVEAVALSAIGATGMGIGE